MSKDKIFFKDRKEAAKQLLEVLPLDSMRLEEWIVISSSYGGYEIAKIVAEALNAKYEIMFNEKIYAPNNDECEIAVVT
ncbi:MAG: ABC transporter, partial [Arcobacter skirrowii]|nr:ABC transporter [Aliarcobacter skirrowii]